MKRKSGIKIHCKISLILVYCLHSDILSVLLIFFWFFADVFNVVLVL